MKCAFKVGAFRRACGREAEYKCTLCGDPVCKEHAVAEYHFHTEKVPS